MGACCSMIFYLAEKAAAFFELGSGIALLHMLYFPVFYRVWLCMIMSLRQKKINLLPRIKPQTTE